MSYLMNNYARLPISFIKGEGAVLTASDGQTYLDAISGIAVCSLGHVHPEITRVTAEQAATLVHTSNLYGIDVQSQLAEKLCILSGMEKAFFANSGTEANEAAIKIARLYGHNQGITLPKIIVTDNAFHGRTMGALAATGNPKAQAGFEPMLDGFVRVPYNDVDAIKAHTPDNEIVAILVEPIQGEAGVVMPDEGYLTQLRHLCDKHNWLLMLDEIQTGVARTGAWFAHQHENAVPDVMTLAKALGNGMPIGVCLAKGIAAETFAPGNHGTTFGGNLLACKVADAVLTVIEQEKLVERAKVLGEKMLSAFKMQLEDVSQVKNIRGKGLMIGIELEGDCSNLVTEGIEQQILINVAGGNKIRLLPPLVITDEEAQVIVDKVCALIKAM